MFDIPVDQWSIRTIAKVGKVMEIDEMTRYRADYVRVKIACKDIQKVPRFAEGTLGLYVKDFIFEREVEEGDTMKTLSSGIKVGEKEPPNKKYKAESHQMPPLLTSSSSQGGPKSANGGSVRDSNNRNPSRSLPLLLQR